MKPHGWLGTPSGDLPEWELDTPLRVTQYSIRIQRPDCERSGHCYFTVMRYLGDGLGV